VRKVQQYPTSPTLTLFSSQRLAMRNDLPLLCGLALIDVDYKHSYRVV